MLQIIYYNSRGSGTWGFATSITVISKVAGSPSRCLLKF
uniref:Uncharacterized protein n=1 Tax=Aquilaria malaccensis TaxID=223753 RepID=A0A4Y6GMS5_9ROSI|nr:hypothetical protein [Aquilaria malaccensis]